MDLARRWPQPPLMVESHQRPRPSHTFLEFFAGGGMVRAGLGEGWRCLLANDIDPAKAAVYRENWGEMSLSVADIGTLRPNDLPGAADLMWGSFPCQDLSLAGAGAGLGGARSGTFHTYLELAQGLAAEGRGPRILAIENVCGALTSRGGRDFETLCRGWVELGYSFGALVINADRFLPQSRPRLFVVGLRGDLPLSTALVGPDPSGPFHTPALRRAAERLPAELAERMVWWRLPPPEAEPATLASVLEDETSELQWHSAEETARLLELMSPVNRAKVQAAQRSGAPAVGAVYRRTRTASDGSKVQRAEVRFDRAGCLRTPGGGSSRQSLLIIDGQRVRSRLMTPREMARLMGLGDDYRLPASHSAARHLTGDGVAVPVVRHLARWLFEPLLEGDVIAARAA
jgi:DNA (cytosine-5)-methyltransferase 1